MTLSTVIYQIHQQTKNLTSILTRSQIYELVASLYGFNSQKLFRQKSIAITGNFTSISLNKTSFLKRCSKLHFSEFHESLYQIISEAIMRNEICIIGLDNFENLVYESLGVIHHEDYYDSVQEIDWYEPDANAEFYLKNNSLYQAISRASSEDDNSNYQLLKCQLKFLMTKQALDDQNLYEEDFALSDGAILYKRWKAGEKISPTFQSLLDSYIKVKEALEFTQNEMKNTINFCLKLDFNQTILSLWSYYELGSYNQFDVESYEHCHHFRVFCQLEKTLKNIGCDAKNDKIHKAIVSLNNLEISQNIQQFIQELDSSYQSCEDDGKEILAIQIEGWLGFADKIDLNLLEIKSHLSSKIRPQTRAYNSKGQTIYDDWEFGDFAGVEEYGGHEPIMELSEEAMIKANQFTARELEIYSAC
ncbi:hypothetical protein [Psychrobacter sp.]|uniref:hypothetical protein n=1 Tax=Psychrobacter sp. TaxID=56811 RepID=UPI003BB0BB0A